MRMTAVLAAAAALALPAAAHAEPRIDTDDTVFDGDYAIVLAGGGYLPGYEGSDDYKAMPLAGVTGEISGVNFAIRGPSLTVRVLEKRISDNAKIHFSPQVRYRGNRSGNVKDEVVALLPDLDGVVEGGFRVGVNFDEILSTADGLSIGVSTRWDISGKGSGMAVTPSATYRLPVSRAQAFGFIVSGQWIDGDYADYNYSISPEGAAASGLPEFEGKGGFKRFSVGVGTARDLSGDALDGGLALGAGVLYTRLYGSAAKTPITAIRGDRDQWFAAGGLAYIF
ncbi:MAG: MipA/OmpV family protein [Sphingomonadaceae bacterium]